MDEELPLLIYLVARCTVPNLFAELNFIKDFIQCDSQLDDETRLLTNFTNTLIYIKMSWEKDEKKYKK